MGRGREIIIPVEVYIEVTRGGVVALCKVSVENSFMLLVYRVEFLFDGGGNIFINDDLVQVVLDLHVTDGEGKVWRRGYRWVFNECVAIKSDGSVAVVLDYFVPA